MLEQQGRVVAVSGRVASVLMGGSSGCSACVAGRGCGAGVFAQLFKRKPATLDLFNEIDARVGQAVMVGLPESLFLRLVFRLYLFPLVMALAGMFLGYYVSLTLNGGTMAGDSLTLVGGVVGGSIGILWNRRVPIEFSANSSVHLLHILRQTKEEQCGGSGSLRNQ